MTLSFQTKIAGFPTHFMEKIIKGYFWTQPVSKEVAAAFHHSEFNSSVLSNCKGKLHTIREDKKNRWKPGMNIHFVIHNRTKKRFQFAPTIKVVSIQKIEIFNPTEYLNDMIIKVDSRELSMEEKQQLAWNDGFECLAEFQMYFNKDFTGKIIHWTDLSYN